MADPTVGYRVLHDRYGLIPAASILADPMGFLRLAFFEVVFVPSGGLAVDAGIPSSRCFLLDMEEVPWYWEQLLDPTPREQQVGHVKLLFLRQGQVRLIAPVPKAPPCTLAYHEYRASIQEAVRDFLSVQDCLSRTFADLDAAATQAEWASQLPVESLKERVTRRSSTFEEVAGMSAADRWAKVVSARAKPNLIHDLRVRAEQL